MKTSGDCPLSLLRARLPIWERDSWKGRGVVEATPHTVTMVGESQYCMVLLKERDGSRMLPVWMHVHRAQPIILWLRGNRLRRPQTHDLFIQMAEKLGGELVQAALYQVKEGVLQARVELCRDRQEISLNCAASDAVVLATKKGVPIAVADEIMEMTGIVPEPSLSERASSQSDGKVERLAAFRDFIERLDLTGIGGPT